MDDNADLVEIFKTVLARTGYGIYTAGGGEECIALLKMIRPDHALVDIIMEPVDGWETLARIRNNPETKSVPVIIVTGKTPTWDEVLSHMDDIEDYVIKPVTMSGLSGLVQGFFHRQEALACELAAGRT